MLDAFLADLRGGWRFFCANPVAEAIFAALFFLAGLTGILLGPAAVMWLWHLNPSRAGANPLAGTPFAPVFDQAFLAQRLQGPRLAAAFWLGLTLWAVTFFFAAVSLFGLIPLGLLLAQPVWLALVLADRFGLPFAVACRVTLRFVRNAPARALGAMAFGLIGCAGAALAGVGLFITLPVANRALLLWLGRCHADLAAAVQESLP